MGTLASNSSRTKRHFRLLPSVLLPTRMLFLPLVECPELLSELSCYSCQRTDLRADGRGPGQ
jgi:hypothetical protein